MTRAPLRPPPILILLSPHLPSPPTLRQHLPQPLPPQLTLSSRTPVVVMEIPVRGALPVLEEDEGCSVSPPGSEERLRHRRQGAGRRWRAGGAAAAGGGGGGGHYLLIVIGEIGTEQQLEAARAHIERGECVRVCVRVWPR